MTNIKRFLCILISIMIIAMIVSSISVMTVFADEGAVVIEEGGGEGGGEGGEGGVEGGDIGGGDDSGDIGYVDNGEGSGDSGDNGNVDSGDGGNVSGGGDNSMYNSNGYVTNSDSNYYYFDEEAAAKSGDPNINKVEEKAELYQTSDLDDSALKENEWSDIKLDTQKTVTPAKSFNAIKENTEKDDNSQWILYIGIVLIGLSALGILYFVVATSVYKKKLDELQNREVKNNARRHNTYYDPSEFSDIEDLSNRVNNSHKYSTNSRRRARQDTAEVYLPRRYARKH